jgi:hypothetical protein
MLKERFPHFSALYQQAKLLTKPFHRMKKSDEQLPCMLIWKGTSQCNING